MKSFARLSPPSMSTGLDALNTDPILLPGIDWRPTVAGAFRPGPRETVAFGYPGRAMAPILEP